MRWRSAGRTLRSVWEVGRAIRAPRVLQPGYLLTDRLRDFGQGAYSFCASVS